MSYDKYFSNVSEDIMCKPLDAGFLDSLSILAKQQLSIDLEQHQNLLELKRMNAIEDESRGERKVCSEWLKRINFRIGICKKQRTIIEKYLQAKRTESFEKAFIQVARIVLDDEDWGNINARAKELANITKRRGEYVSQEP